MPYSLYSSISPVHIQNDPPQIATEFIPPPQVSCYIYILYFCETDVLAMYKVVIKYFVVVVVVVV